jgi:hypothetical protein
MAGRFPTPDPDLGFSVSAAMRRSSPYFRRDRMHGTRGRPISSGQPRRSDSFSVQALQKTTATKRLFSGLRSSEYF